MVYLLEKLISLKPLAGFSAIDAIIRPVQMLAARLTERFPKNNQTKKNMPKIELTTEISSTLEICFDLSRSIDLHKISTTQTNEQAISGRTNGLINLNETVTWQATHFGVRQKLTSKIIVFDRPNYFVDEQIKGIFKSIIHEHIFEKVGDKVIMKDIFEFHSPFGLFGKLFNKLVLTNYLKKFLIERNLIIKQFAETEKWKEVLNGE
jgi:ligand-binding SRPBCC domain-containing protein